jgi:hypothetical protein
MAQAGTVITKSAARSLAQDKRSASTPVRFMNRHRSMERRGTRSLISAHAASAIRAFVESEQFRPTTHPCRPSTLRFHLHLPLKSCGESTRMSSLADSFAPSSSAAACGAIFET